MSALVILILLIAFLGHAMLSVRVLNRLHAFPLRRSIIKVISLGIYWFGAGVPVLVATWAWCFGWRPWHGWPSPELPYAFWVAGYVAIALLAACVLVPQWLYWRLTFKPPEILLSNHSVREDLGRHLGPRAARGLGSLYSRLPGNEILHLETNEKTIVLPRWPRELDGFSIAHISDLHLTGWIDRCWFAEALARVNQMEADLVMIAGDLADNNRSIDVTCELLAGLRSRYGVYFVRGNHDRRVDHRRLRDGLVAAGLVDLAASWRTLQVQSNVGSAALQCRETAPESHDVSDLRAGRTILLAGNELPWFPPAPDLAGCPALDELQGRIPRIALCHTPDQLRWARRHDFDLLLAGHTHGGQIRMPLLGPIVAPSRHGVRYASGTFYELPTLMHVSRGVSSLQLVRWNCPPEISKLVLRWAGYVE
jgi:hypothetical protein